MANEIVEAESPLKKFDSDVLKSIGSTAMEGSAPRSLFLVNGMGEAMEMAKLMAASNFVAPHMRGKAGDCLAVVMQASRWGMDPFAVANKTFFVNDRIAYESQLVNAVVNSSNALAGRLRVSWEGEGNDLVCVVSGHVKGDPDQKTRRVPIKNITTRNSPLWKQDPEQQLAYYATRAWARLFTPEVLMGVYTPDEVREMAPVDGGEVRAEPAGPKRLTSDMLQAQAIDEGRSDSDMGEAHSGSEDGDDSPSANKARELIAKAEGAADGAALSALYTEAQPHLEFMAEEWAVRVTDALADADARLTNTTKGE